LLLAQLPCSCLPLLLLLWLLLSRAAILLLQ
jgi:hypothetical protein